MSGQRWVWIQHRANQRGYAHAVREYSRASACGAGPDHLWREPADEARPKCPSCREAVCGTEARQR